MWQVTWRFGKSVFQPGDKDKVQLWLKNMGYTPIFVSQLGLQFSWQKNWTFLRPNIILNPNRQYMARIDFEIPADVTPAVYYFRFGAKENQGIEWIRWQKINIEVLPKLKAFVSRLSSPQEKKRIRPILDTIEAYGFELYTYEGPNSPEAPYKIAQQLKKRDCVIVIATSQFYDPVHSTRQTSPWLHREFFGGLTQGKPSVIFRERGVYFDGLLSPTVPTVEFSSIQEAIQRAYKLLPKFRESILRQQKRTHIGPWKAFLIGMAVGGSIIGIIGGIISRYRAKMEFKHV